MSSTMVRRLSRRPGNTMEAEREDFLKHMAVAISKAINKEESPVKEKHLRITILGTHKEQGAAYFWDNVVRLQIEGHPLIAWKFAHVFHKVMREGHPNVLKDSAKFKTKIGNLGKYWGHLKDGYGILIEHYCKLLLTKLDFHGRNPEVPGNLAMSDRAILGLGGGEVDGLYQFSIEALDYLDDILLLQRRVFDSMDMSRAQSLTQMGQCRLAPLILCIQDASALYDFLVKVLFFLHARCPHDALAGHRERFLVNFRALRTFFATAANLQYYKHLVSIPPLPELPPNFTVASELEAYVPHRVTVHGHEDELDLASDPPLASLIDISTPSSPPQTPRPAPTPTPPAQLYQSPPPPQTQQANGEELAEKEAIIASLTSDLEDTKTLVARLRGEFEEKLGAAQTRALELDEEKERYRAQAETLQNENNLATAAQLSSLSNAASANEEKFRKMKEVYGRLREEHIQALSKLAAAQKEAESSKTAAEERGRGERAEERRGICEAMVAAAREEAQDPAHLSVNSSPEFILGRIAALRGSGSDGILACHYLCHLLSFLKAAANDAPAEKAAALNQAVESLAEAGVALGSVDGGSERLSQGLESAEEALHWLARRVSEASETEDVEALLDKEMSAMDRAIEAAAAKIQEIQARSNAEASGVRLAVNEKILSACTSLMAAVLALVARSRELQAEIVKAGKGAGSPRDFYKRNSRWTEGLLSAAKAVGMAAGVLVRSADSAMVGEGKLEELVVASHEIAAATAQLVVASKVKAEAGSQGLTALSTASKGVTAATADVLGTVNAARQSLDEAEALDFANISIHQSKKMEMESQVRVLELESLLQKERVRLGQLRKNNYRSSEDEESSKEATPNPS